MCIKVKSLQFKIVIQLSKYCRGVLFNIVFSQLANLRLGIFKDGSINQTVNYATHSKNIISFEFNLRMKEKFD